MIFLILFRFGLGIFFDNPHGLRPSFINTQSSLPHGRLEPHRVGPLLNMQVIPLPDLLKIVQQLFGLVLISPQLLQNLMMIFRGTLIKLHKQLILKIQALLKGLLDYGPDLPHGLDGW